MSNEVGRVNIDSKIFWETRGPTGRSPILERLSDKGEARLPGIGCGFFTPTTFSGSKPSQVDFSTAPSPAFAGFEGWEDQTKS